MSLSIVGPSLDGEPNQTVGNAEAMKRLAGYVTYGAAFVSRAYSTTFNVTSLPFVGTQGCHARTIATAGKLTGDWGWLVIDSSSFN
ncbi:hypothetical protein ARSEF1564_007065 [Beauveria bassiana]